MIGLAVKSDAFSVTSVESALINDAATLAARFYLAIAFEVLPILCGLFSVRGPVGLITRAASLVGRASEKKKRH